MSKLTRIIEHDTGYDVLPISFARPLITPPRRDNDPIDPPRWAYFCANHRRIEVLEEEITLWPAMARCGGRPVILEKGAAIFIGPHLWKPEKRDRLLVVLQGVFGDDVLTGSSRRWIATAGVASN